jgi:hypothetical protein
MKSMLKVWLVCAFVCFSFLLAACSGVKQSSGGGGGGGGSATHTISVNVTGLSGSGLVVQNGADTLAISANGTVAFATQVANNAAYAVTVKTQPTTPAQTCIVTTGSGIALTNVMVQVNCASGAVTLGGQVTGLTGTGLVLQNNGGDNLTINSIGTFTFGTPVAMNSNYSVTVLAQPTNPAQICTVASGSGTVTASVGNIVVTCSVGTLSVGGSVSGLAGTGLVLQDNGGDNLAVSANGTFKFASLIPSGGNYAVTILTQPSGPAQTCTVTGGSGTTTANVTNVQIICPAVFHTIGGQLVGLDIPTGQTSQMVLQDNGGDNLPISGNGAFTFVTQIAHGSTFDVNIFVDAGTQPQGCIIWGFQGTALTDITSVTVDCGHNDWTWISGSTTSNQFGSASTNPPTPPTVDRDTPAGTRYPATWTDLNGSLWLFSGYGYSSDSAIPNQPSFFSEMWEYTGTGTANYHGDYVDHWNQISKTAMPTARWGAVTWTDPSTGLLWMFGGQDALNDFLNDVWTFDPVAKTWTQISGGFNLNGVYGTKGTPAAGNLPGGRWGATGRLDASGNLWLFGGFGYDSTSATPGLLNDLWKFSGGQWTWVNGSNLTNQNGVYGTQGTAAGGNMPGGRQASTSWIDASGNFWVFGGYNLSATGQPNAFNDLWEFSGGQWKWVTGANIVNQVGVYGTQGTAAGTNTPGARWSMASWNDKDVLGNSRLWLFGGQGFDATGNGSLADLWVFTKGQWTWVKGSNSVSQSGIYGLQSNPVFWPHITNNPGARYAPGYWIDNSGQFWMFGGEGFDASSGNGNGLLNDLWRYLPFPN